MSITRGPGSKATQIASDRVRNHVMTSPAISG